MPAKIIGTPVRDRLRLADKNEAAGAADAFGVGRILASPVADSLDSQTFSE